MTCEISFRKMCVLGGGVNWKISFWRERPHDEKAWWDENHWPSCLGGFLACCKSHIKCGVVSLQPSRQGKINGFALWVLFSNQHVWLTVTASACVVFNNLIFYCKSAFVLCSGSQQGSAVTSYSTYPKYLLDLNFFYFHCAENLAALLRIPHCTSSS